MTPVGVGGMGEVWKARDTRVDRIVAIKRLKAEHAQRFKREARAIAALNHPHICQLYDVGPDYLVMEYVEGTPLKGPLPVANALRLAGQIAEALAAAHCKGIVHRDLKPDNILVNESGAKLLDFGLATMDVPTLSGDGTISVALSELGAVVGTAAYMSPEQAQGHSVDARSDVFSFGAVLYEVLSGCRAFRGDSLFATITAVVNEDPPPLEAPAALERIVNRCLAKQPRERFQSMAEVTAALGQVAVHPADPQPSIAVLPFTNMSRDPDDEFFSDGLAEELINLLAHVPNLKVTARTSAFAFRGKEQDIRRIAAALGVRTILEGSVRRAGSRIRVTAQLINAEDGYHLWSERYDREFTDVFAIQDEIATAIAGALQVRLAVVRPYTPNLAAYEAFLQGRHHWAKLTPESLKRSRECFERAVALDSQFAAARCSLAEHFFALAANGLMPAHEAMPQARAGALRALEIDPSLPDAHGLLGLVAMHYDYDWTETAGRFRSAMTQQPVPPRIRWLYGQYLFMIGRDREGIEELELALQDDPLHLLCRSHLAAFLHAAGKHAEAIRQVGQVLEMDESFGVAHWYMTVFHALEGTVAAAHTSAEKAYSLRPWDTMAVGLLAGVVACEGDAARAESLLTEFSPGRYGAAVGWAAYHLARLEIDQAADWIGKAIEQRDSAVPVLLPYVRTSSRWPALAKMMNLPEVAP
jgi:serine/threonine-protein kinase